jgi:hypothetical protein
MLLNLFRVQMFSYKTKNNFQIFTPLNFSFAHVANTKPGLLVGLTGSSHPCYYSSLQPAADQSKSIGYPPLAQGSAAGPVEFPAHSPVDFALYPFVVVCGDSADAGRAI